MANMTFDRLDSLEKSRSDFKIKVRVTRMWPTVSAESGVTKGFNLILLDDDNTHLHAFVYADVWNSIGRDVVEGGVYVLQNFSVRDSIGNLKPVSSPFVIRCQAGTTFQACNDDAMIPAHKFEFLDLGDCFKEASRYEANENPEYAIDIIGVVEEFERLRTISTRFGTRDIVRFRICDHSYRHRVGVWGDLARTVQNEYDICIERPVIAIITSTKLSTYKNSVQVSTLPSSKVYFNLNDECVNEMRMRLLETGYGAKTVVDEMSQALTIIAPFQKISLLDLTANPAEHFKKRLFCNITIISLEEGTDWYLNACSICHAELIKIDKVFNCGDCFRNIPISEKRYAVHVVADDSTMACSVILMDRVVKPIVGINASNLIKKPVKDYEDIEDIPAVLLNLIAKEIIVSIEVVKNKIGDDFSFHAVDMYVPSADNGSPSISSPPPEIPAIEFPSVNLTDSFDEIANARTPGSTSSVNKKMKKEK